MRFISNSTGSLGGSETSRKNGNIADTFAGEEFFKNDSIRRANIIQIDRVFKYYGINVNKYNKKIICPFKNHKGGRENSASFIIYPETNTYCCFGCHQGSKVVDFVSIMDNITKQKAAIKILELFSDTLGTELDEDIFIDKKDFSEQLEIMMLFSNEIREFRKKHIDNESVEFIDNICKTYDDICIKHELDNEALRLLIEKYQRKIKLYIACLTKVIPT